MEPLTAEADWVAGLRRGDPAAFDAVFAAFRRRIYAYLLRMTRRRDVAEDLLQETFLRLSQNSKKLRADTRLQAWLFTVAHRLVQSWGRAQQVRAQLAGDLPATEPAAPTPSPLDQLSDSRTQLALERAFAALSPEHREVALLVGVEGMQPSDVAEILGLRADAVRQRLARARAQLSELLGDVR
ncbi:MAG: RNA polymerase sigma factor [Kofleriaceae bacterium]